ncbi:cytochrome c biogenesis protein CcsA [Marseilla massiliensis]|uniref:Cytochrome c biogenesis protein CcsA n=1 Tax=Marseilla massiliensis TaxID=1841864 RepID=A0A939B6W8_9BACT|nr:cytochrome c biogenesis protein CcsA [Marseilla massiliensis]MBM6674679.1 cytochrome c biogenesis protein CcsA [Marseilla massiliensis]
MLKKILFALYILVIVVMAAATFVEKFRGTEFVHASVYGSWWFVGLWAVLALLAVAYFVGRRVRRASVVLLHLSFAVILAGALLTHVTSWQGAVRLRVGETVSTYYENVSGGDVVERKLPFELRLESFDVKYHDGTRAEADYVSRFTITDGGATQRAEVSMNNVWKYRSVRFYQSSYDPDMRGSILALNSDPWGIPVTYAGYALLFLSLVWLLVDPKGAFRRLFKSDMMRRGVLSVMAVCAMSQAAGAANTLPRETADRLGRLNILYNDRVCPLQTFAVDFTKKLCGSARYGDYTPEQVLAGFIFYGDEWSAEPIIRVKNGPLRDALQLPGRCSVNTFFNQVMGGYILGPYLNEYYHGHNGKFHKQVADIDDRLMMVMELRRGTLLRVFPFTSGGKTTWYSPTENITDTLVDEAHRKYMQNVFSLIYGEVLASSYGNVDKILDKMLKYQQLNGGSSLPSAAQVKAERLYNAIPFATILFMVNLTLGVVLLIIGLVRLIRPVKTDEPDRPDKALLRAVPVVGGALLGLSLLALTACIALRWIVGGRVPMANGYETMLLMAWFVMVLALVAARRFRIALPFGFLMSGFFLLVSHINQMDPQITHIMPVLSSPLLSVHVSVIMMSFALLSLTFICGLTAIILRLVRGRNAVELDGQLDSLALLSRLLLYPALTLLGVGIFVGAIWANVSWGAYWSWDAKEVWGLITLMVYAVAAHAASVPFLRRSMGYHIFMTLAFLTLVMTYFGVNYFLGGMHSYA